MPDISLFERQGIRPNMLKSPDEIMPWKPGVAEK
jgi:hypothetical protein